MGSRRVHVAAVLVIAVAAVSFILATGSVPRNEEIVVAYAPFASNLPLFVGVKQGFFESRGVRVRLEKMVDTKQINDALLAGSVDAAFANGLEVVLSSEARQPGGQKIIGAKVITASCFDARGCDETALLVAYDSNLSRIEDLRGARIGFHPSAAQRLMWALWARRALGGNATLVDVPATLQLEALSSHRVDAILAFEPTVRLATSKKAGKVLLPSAYTHYLPDPAPWFLYSISTRALREKPVAASAFIAGFKDALLFIRDNPDQARQDASKYAGIDEQLAASMGMLEQEAADEINQTALNYYASLLASEGLVPAVNFNASDLLYAG